VSSSIGKTLWSRRIPMRDGVHVVADVVLPAGEGPFPAVVERTPYSRGRLLNPVSWLRLVDRGYAFVTVDVRGRGDSEGVFKPFHSDGYDGYDTVEWVAAQPWCTGRVGMVGISYDALTQWWTARHKPPHLACIAPMASGAVRVGPLPHLGTGIPLQYWMWWAHYVTGRTAQHTGAVSWSRGWEHLPLRTFDEHLGTGHAWWQQFVRGEFDLGDPGCVLTDEEWARYDVPTLVCVGWWDEQTTIDTWTALQRSQGAADTHLVIGGWDHAGNNAPRPELGGLDVSAGVIDLFGEVERFLAVHLKPGEGAQAPPRCRMFRTGAMEWDHVEQWPDPSAATRELYLRSGGHAQSLNGDGQLASEPPPANEEPDTLEYDPAAPDRSLYNLDLFAWSDPPLDQRYMQRRPSTLVYTSEPLIAPLTVSGQALLDAFASSDRPDSDLIVEIADVHPDGRAITFHAGARRLRYLDDGAERLLAPGEIRRVTVAICWLHHTFLPGHAIRVAIRSSAFPFHSRNLNGGGSWADEAEPLVARNTVHHDAESPSRLLLPVVEREDAHAL
jgi:putative CocE/NonD family hydrolase